MRFVDVEPPLRYFTPEEANAMLPRVRALMNKATEDHRRLREQMQRAGGEGREELDVFRRRARECVRELRELGVEVKALDTGLADFPALRNGEYVYLCWRIGEPRVEWWHPLSTGFAGRQRIVKDPAVRWEWRN